MKDSRPEENVNPQHNHSAAVSGKIKFNSALGSKFRIPWKELKSRYTASGYDVKSRFEISKNTYAQLIYPSGVGLSRESFEKYLCLIAHLFPEYGEYKYSDLAESLVNVPNVLHDKPLKEWVVDGRAAPVSEATLAIESQPQQSVHESLVPALHEYFADLASALSRFPWKRPGNSSSFFDSIHIEVRLAPRRTQASLARTDLPISLAGDYDEAQSRSYSNRADTKQFVHDAARTPQHWSNALAAHSARLKYPWAVILADPGMGKSTLLRYEGWLNLSESLEKLQSDPQHLSELLIPIYIRLADLAESAPSTDVAEVLTDLAMLPCHSKQSAGYKELRSFIVQQIHAGHTVVLLDAQDEVSNTAFKRLSRQLAGIAALNPQRLYLTSRRAGYRGADFEVAGQSAPELEIVAFSMEDIRRFINAFFEAHQLPDGNLIASRVYESLSADNAIRGLTQTPLLLTMLCAILWERYQDGTPVLPLPTRRSELYAEFMKGLLGGWAMYRKGEIANPRLNTGAVNLRYPTRLRLAARLAWELTNRTFEKTIFTWSEVRESLKRCRNELKAANCSSISKAIDLLHRHIGLLTEEGRELMFLHLTLQEYLVANHLANVLNEQGWEASVKLRSTTVKIRDFLQRIAWLPRWQETMVLLAGQLQDVEPLLQLLTNADEDDYFRHKLGIAARSVAELALEQHPRKRLNNVCQKCESIVDEVFQLCWKRRLDCEELLAAHLEPTLGLLATSSFGRIYMDSPLRQLLTAIVSGNVKVQRGAFALLEQLMPVVGEEVVDRLMSIVEGDVTWAKAKAAILIGKLPNAVRPECEQELLACLTEREASVREAAATGLFQLGERVSASTTNALLELISHEDAGISNAAATALAGSIQKLRPVDRAGFSELLESDFQSIRVSAIRAASGLCDTVTPDELRCLIASLKDNASEVINAAATTIGKLQWRLNEEQLQYIIGLLKHKKSFTRYGAARTLGEMSDRHTVSIVNQLIGLLGDVDGGVRESAARALRNSQWTVTDSQLDDLSRRLEYGITGEKRAIALTFAAFMNRLRSVDIKRLIHSLQCNDDGVATAAVKALSAVRERFSKSHQHTLYALLDSPNEKVQVWTAAILGPLQILLSEQGIAELPNLITRAGSATLGTRYAAIQAVAELGDKADSDHIAALFKSLHSTSDFTSRLWAGNAFRRLHSLGVRIVHCGGKLAPVGVERLSQIDGSTATD